VSPDAPTPPPPTPDPAPSAAPGPTPGEVVRPGQRPLERPPSDRYATTAEAAPAASGSLVRVLAGAVVPAAIGGGLLVLFASPLAVSEPLVVVALLLGLGAGFGARLGGGTRVPVARRRAIAAAAALATVALAELVVWRLALGEGGVLPFLDYEWLVFGPVALLQPLAAGLAAWAAA
jgi:hypothetical protein